MWAIGVKDIDTGSERIFKEPDRKPEEFLEYAKGVTLWVGHNFLGFDLPVINKLVAGANLDPTRVVDTLVVSRLVDYKRNGGHSLEAWGESLGREKLKFDHFSDFLDHWEEGITYLKQDLDTNLGVFEHLRKYIYSPRWRDAMRLEHDTQIMCNELHNNGFKFDIVKATSLYDTLISELSDIEADFQTLFPPRYKLVKEINPALTKTGKLHSKDFRWLDGNPELLGYAPACPFSLVEPVPFDPASKIQVIDRLWDAGWKPTAKTDGYKDFIKNARRNGKDPVKLARYQRYGWKIDDTNLATLPSTAPEGAKRLTRWLHLTGRKNQLRNWIDLYNPETGRIHGNFMHIGAWTHRMAHAAPNMANATAEHEYRELWVADEGTVLVGCDAEGIQLRILAHYINDPTFTKALISGDKKEGTDAHSLNASALGEVCLRHGEKARDRAKTFIYAFVLGASPGKIAEIFECTTPEAEEAINKFIQAYPGLAKLKKEIIPADARRGYFEGFDGRCVKQDSEHLMLAGYLQNGESILMKKARAIWSKELREKGIWFKHVNLVHDEFQTVARREDADTVGRIQAAAIVQAGVQLNVRCPQAGEYKIGGNWAETH